MTPAEVETLVETLRAMARIYPHWSDTCVTAAAALSRLTREVAERDAAITANLRESVGHAERANAAESALTAALKERDETMLDRAISAIRTIAYPDQPDAGVGPEWYQGIDAALEILHEIKSKARNS